MRGSLSVIIRAMGDGDSFSVDCVVIGAGVVGLAVARELSRAGLETLCIEQADRIGSATSSRNSEVIHAGIHYPPGSLKATLCIEGKQQLYGYCRDRGIGHRRCGKLVVATAPGDLPKLERIAQNAQQCGVRDLQWLDPQAARERQPELHCLAALWSPSTGIVDSHGLMLALQADIEAEDGQVLLHSRVRRINRDPGGFVLQVESGGPQELRTRRVVNSAGLQAHELAKLIEDFPARHVPVVHFARGNYFSLASPAPFDCLVYPVPPETGLGIHLTLDLAGRARFGPDLEWVDRIDYRVDPARLPGFIASIRRYWPALPDHALRPDYSGIRPRLHGPGESARDFMLQTPADHGVDGLVNLFGIESPGLTSCLALAAQVRRTLIG